MLTDEQKSHIREEEKFRREVQRQLEAEKPPPSTKKTSWDLVNSPIALWLLSTVFVGLLGWGYANIQEFNKEQAHKKEIKRKIINEISNRAIESQFVLFDAETKSAQRVPDSPRLLFSTITEMFDGKAMGAKGNVNSIYSEYQNRSFPSLMTELDSVINEESKKYLSQAGEIYWELRISSRNDPEFEANDDVETKVGKSSKAIEKARLLIDGLMTNLGRAAGAKLPPRMGGEGLPSKLTQNRPGPIVEAKNATTRADMGRGIKIPITPDMNAPCRERNSSTYWPVLQR